MIVHVFQGTRSFAEGDRHRLSRSRVLNCNSDTVAHGLCLSCDNDQQKTPFSGRMEGAYRSRILLPVSPLADRTDAAGETDNRRSYFADKLRRLYSQRWPISLDRFGNYILESPNGQ